MSLIIILAIIVLAYSNGANDNFKGVATLFGSGTTDYKTAIRWATISTLAGSVASIFLASKLLANFSGKGLVSESLMTSPAFAFSVALGAAFTILLATKIGMPVSTTHGLIGALAGVGLVASISSFNFSKLGASFFFPLLSSPLIAAMISLFVYLIFTQLRKKSGITKESCACIIQENNLYAFKDNSLSSNNELVLKLGTITECKEKYNGTIIGISAQKLLDSFHFMSAAAVGFARGLNDTPKILGLLLLIGAFNIQFGASIIAIAMAVGGLLNAKKVAQTISKKITKMNHGQGFTANLITALLVTTASFNGLPVSTTHVSVGSLFGIGIITKQANYKVIKNILMSWLFTLPVAAILSAGTYFIFTKILN